MHPACQEASTKLLRTRGNITIDMEWKDGKVISYTLTTTDKTPAPVKLIVNGEATTLTPTVK